MCINKVQVIVILMTDIPMPANQIMDNISRRLLVAPASRYSHNSTDSTAVPLPHTPESRLTTDVPKLPEEKTNQLELENIQDTHTVRHSVDT